MKASAFVATAALLCATAAFAQQTYDHPSNSSAQDGARVEHKDQDQGTVGQKMRNAMHKLGEKTRHAFHRMGDSAHNIAHRDHADNTHAMGAGGTHDTADARQQRMDDAYSNYHAKQDNSQRR